MQPGNGLAAFALWYTSLVVCRQDARTDVQSSSMISTILAMAQAASTVQGFSLTALIRSTSALEIH